MYFFPSLSQGDDLALSYAKMQTVFNAAQFVGGLLSGPLAGIIV